MINYKGNNIKRIIHGETDVIAVYYGNVQISCFPNNQEEIFCDPDFNFGLDFWKDTSSNYQGQSIDNGDGTVKLLTESSSNYLSLEQPDKMPLEPGLYVVEFTITDISVDTVAKFSIKIGESWISPIDGITAPGTYKEIYEATDEINTVRVGHNSSPADKYIVFDKINMIAVNETQTPCMTSYTSPYGIVEVSTEFSGLYAGWKGMNCTADNTSDAWLTPVWNNAEAPDPEAGEVWFQWYLTDDDLAAGMSLMYPTKITIKPRIGMTTSWYIDNNPYRMRIVGINEDMSEEVLVNEYMTDNWTGSGTREIDLTGLATSRKRGIKVYILGTKGYDGGGSFHSGWAWVKAEGIY